MAFIYDAAFDAALDLINNGTRIDICTQEPVSYTEASSTYTAGNKTGLTVGSAGDRTGGGRKVTVPSFSDGSVTDSDTATHWALSLPGSSLLIATGSLASSQAVVSGNTFSLTAFDIGFADAVNET